MTASATSSDDDRIYGWYLYNVLTASVDDRITRLIRRYITSLNRPKALNDAHFVDIDPAREESARPAGQRPILARYLARFANRPEPPDDELARNYPFLAAAFALTPLDVDILRLVVDARRIYYLDRFCDAVCNALRNPARSIGALVGAAPSAVEGRLLRAAPLRACGMAEVNPASTTLQGSNNLLDIAPRIWRALQVPADSPARPEPARPNSPRPSPRAPV